MDDQAIISLYWDRNEHAIHETDQQYGRYCYAISLRILCNQEDAQECVNDTWLRAWQAIPPTRPSRFAVWLGRITRNLSLNKLAVYQAQKRGGGEADVVFSELENWISGLALRQSSVIQNSFTATPSPEEAVVIKELAEEIGTFLVTLPDEKQKAFVGRYYYFASLDEIALQTGLSKSQLSVMLHRIRQDLAQYLRERGYDL